MSTSNILNELSVPKTHAFRNSIYFYITLALSLIYIGLSRLSIIDLIQINWDAPILIDGSYRLFLGQSAHDDFSTPVGPLNFLPGALGMSLSGQSILGLNTGIVVFGLLLPLLFVRKLIPSLGYFASYFYGISVALLLMSPATLKWGGYFSYTSPYNSWAYAILSFTLLSSVLGLHQALFRNQSEKVNFFNPFTVGVATACLLYIKFPFFIVSFGVTLVAICIDTNRVSNLRKLFVGCLISIALIHILLDFSFTAMIRDFGMMLSSRVSGADEFVSGIVKYLQLNIIVLLVVASSSLILSRFLAKERIFILSLTILIICIDISLQLTIQQEPELVLPAFITFIIWSWQRDNLAMNSLPKLLRITLGVVCFIPISLLIYSNGAEFISKSAARVIALDFASTSTNVPIESVYPEERELDEKISKLINKNTKLLVVGCNDVYSFKYGLEHSESGLLFWHKGVTFATESLQKNSYFSEATIFKDVNLIVASYSCPHGDSAREFSAHYTPFLESEFVSVEATDEVDIWTR
jgi:hypothetical protein